MIELTPLSQWGLFDGRGPAVIAGPCSAETLSQVMETASGLKKAGVGVFRAGLWKPRTHPGSFEGVGRTGLEWLREVKERTGLKIATEVAGAEHVRYCLDSGVDMLWIGARTTANPFLVEEIACALDGADLPVLVKNPVSPDIGLWIGALERLSARGVRKLGVVHRGFPSLEKTIYRNAPEWRVAIEMRTRFPHLPFFCDPSHMAGDRKYIREISQRAMDLGLDGLMIESHCDPQAALSDASQQITPEELSGLLSGLEYRRSGGDGAECVGMLSEMRARIDIIDETIVQLLAERMAASRQIGKFKKENGIAILQTSRWDEVLERVTAEASSRGLDENTVRNIFNEIHRASVEEQK